LRPLGATGLRVAPLGFGAGPLGSDALSDAEAERLVDRALDLGLRLVDTAPSYGSSELRLGRVLRRRRGEAVVSTKLGYGVPGVPDWTGPCIAAGVDRALRVLGVDVLDVAHLHSCPREVLERGEVTEALLAAVAAGKVRAAAYSGEGEALDHAVRSGAFAVVQASASVCDPAAEGLGAARERGLGTIAKRPLANAPWTGGVYADRWRALGIGELGDLGMGWPELLLRWAAFHPAVDVAIVGTSSLARLEENAAAVARGRCRSRSAGWWTPRSPRPEAGDGRA
jgi:aryl-alcohol dehydrogenase-like predicted oxidoreductase